MGNDPSFLIGGDDKRSRSAGPLGTLKIRHVGGHLRPCSVCDITAAQEDSPDPAALRQEACFVQVGEPDNEMGAKKPSLTCGGRQYGSAVEPGLEERHGCVDETGHGENTEST